MKLNMF